MKTRHSLTHGRAQELALDDGSVQLVVTSPPYPMIAMWDEVFPSSSDALARSDGPAAFEAMHQELDACWAELFRVLQPGGLACINIGDATRSLGGQFALYPNHARILSAAMRLGFTVLPDILWRKPNNSPTKFMGSGMLPAGAYVTYEHEYVLVLRKGGKRAFTAKQAETRRKSALFWEERNVWFSDLWELKGTGQKLSRGGRDRSAAFPFELAWRLICMYSMYGDVVLDPFAGTGTTLCAAAVAGRNGVGVDLDAALVAGFELELPERARPRLAAHRAFVADRETKHDNPRYGAVVTAQERKLELWEVAGVSGLEVDYALV
ncbi:MAG: site-specific DNA-methyltransferase [Proteobacteria bacterium]|nr:site-specific DNA-methyltransferase [Pseudomonadota bacterium]MCP4920033.1 site-specific DNA-methyltransferase [Pseudomonadota bacterium]